MKRLQMWLQRLNEEKGVTLIELLAVVVILAIIAAVAIPVIMGQINKSKINTDKDNEKIIIDALQRADFDYESTQSGDGTMTLSFGTGDSGTLAPDETDTTVNVTFGSNTDNMYDVLVKGITSGSGTTGQTGGYLDEVPKAQTGTDGDWTITTSDQSTNSEAAPFSFGGGTTYYIYPAGSTSSGS
ncbi:prepilin-type N-terminal cleavage/methylation domain-containing protein [Alicyclobacillus suci]|uniref:prepilin-type N-terminal cleavage/methylation domain-containing protein n=1 Tax=Alicyclobacillus suci TaxID=2816080 RepID=UPI001CB7746E|nr:prepilin-type N-terminal cleavage/methylation domain-containing protein [Alicyclobacillus suci]